VLLGGEETVKRILLCTDGEEQTRKAEEYAFMLAEQSGALIVGLYVVDPFLKKFTDEIYAVNRDECRDHLDKSLLDQGRLALESLSTRSKVIGVSFNSKIRYGDPAEEILKELAEGDYDILIMGAKLLKGWKQRFESVNLPKKIFKEAPLPVLFVR
jgi:nucleotide-binding universal stress UspA family protein